MRYRDNITEEVVLRPFPGQSALTLNKNPFIFPVPCGLNNSVLTSVTGLLDVRLISEVTRPPNPLNYLVRLYVYMVL